MQISARELLEAGVHYGHRVSRWNPKMAPFIYGKRNLIHIVDIRATLRGLIQACTFLRNLTIRGEQILFVGTKRQAASTVRQEAERCGMPYVSERWLGGTLTNYATIRSRLSRLREIETWEQDGTIQRYTKKEIAGIQREKRKLLRNLGGIRGMDRLPAALVVIDPTREKIAVDEALKAGAAIAGLIDTDGDPSRLDISIPGNDDSMKVIHIIMARLADAVLEGKARATVPREENAEAAGAAVVSQG